MKRFLGILVCAIAFNSCDDGDLIVENIDFSDVSTQSCSTNNLLFKLNDKESLVLDIPATSFTSDATPVGDPTEVNLSSTNQVHYRFYDGAVVSSNICDVIRPATPNVISEWIASDGIVQIVTTAVKAEDATAGSTRITGYNHNIIFKNITFNKGNGTSQFYESFAFGDYLESVDALPFDLSGLLNICSTGQVYDYGSSESLTLDIDPLLIANEITPVNTPRTGIIGATVNKLVYRLFTNGVVTGGYFCNDTIPLTPTVSQEWLGEIGGTVEVTTTSNGPNVFKHTIVLKNVTLVKGNSDFQLGTSYKYGELQTTAN